MWIRLDYNMAATAMAVASIISENFGNTAMGT
jgi:hypothetical protein